MMLGRYLARGLAGERDFDRARVWLDRALAQGLQEARNDLAVLPVTTEVSRRSRRPPD